jgi:hypothetical protein
VKAKAVDLQSALTIYRAVNDKSSEADTLSALAAFTMLRVKASAEFCNQALPLKRSVGDKGGKQLRLRR